LWGEGGNGIVCINLEVEMLTYLIAGVITFLFTTVLSIAGIGAAFILIPVFVALGIPLLTAMSVALLLNSISMTFASINYAKSKLILFKVSIPIIISAAILSPLGALSAQHLPKTVLLWLFIAFLIFAGSMMLFYNAKGKEFKAGTGKMIGYGSTVGAVAGYLGGLLGVGGGNFIVPVLVWLGIDPKKASATTAFVVIFSSLAGFLGHAALGDMSLYLLGFTVVGSIAGALLGSYLMNKKLNTKQVKIIIGVVLYLIAAQMIWKLLVK